MESAAPGRKLHKLTGFTRDRQGCLTCRRRKKKCAEGGRQSRCAQCTRLNLRCVWEDERTVRGSPSPDREENTSTALVLSTPLTPAWAAGSGNEAHDISHRQMALRYYIQSFASTLSTNAENNGFLSILLPMAMTDAPLMDTLVAWSTSHLAIRQQNVQVKALEDRSVALRSFATNLRDLPPLTCLAICLVLTSMEAVLGNTLSWYSHLSAAARIINSTVSPRLDDSSLASSLDSSAEGRWLLRNFSYHDILASVSRSRAMLIPGLDFLGADTIQVPDTYLGFGVPPMKLLGEINVLSQTLTNYENTSNTASAADDSSDAGEIAARLYAIEAELRQWRADGSPDDPLIMLADSYRSAILICLYRALRYHRLADPTTATEQIQAEVGEIVTRITSLPHGSSPECTLLFPLFMAGGEAQSTEHRAAIENRMETIAENREFQNLREALDVLKEVWSVQSRTTAIDPARPYDWTCVLERRQWDLALS